MLDQIKDTQASAVIYQVLKFCEPYLYDSVYILQRLKDEGYPVLLLEHEYTTQGVEALRTRIEAFKETMGSA
jgi:benzoyl-CoA reductase/2-hydroxyglutaryl-CoA dehydratase subunit BcrC/BadD/HgdB